MMIVLQVILLVVPAPFISGLITRIKNNLRMRQGQSVFQPYYNLAKLFSKEEVVSETASWIFRVTPFIVFASTLTAGMLVPVFVVAKPVPCLGDFLVLVFVFSLGRFFLSLAALDTASAFGGMGASREMFISSLVEPALCMVIFALSLQFKSTDLYVLRGAQTIPLSSFVAAVALFLVAIAETSRIPVDNQETHLELTMVHEAMVLEYSGRSLALIELASSVKQMIFFYLIAQIVFPVVKAGDMRIFFLGMVYNRIVVIACIIAVVEISLAKMRLFRVADFLGFAFVLGIIAALCALWRA